MEHTLLFSDTEACGLAVQVTLPRGGSLGPAGLLHQEGLQNPLQGVCLNALFLKGQAPSYSLVTESQANKKGLFLGNLQILHVSFHCCAHMRTSAERDAQASALRSLEHKPRSIYLICFPREENSITLGYRTVLSSTTATSHVKCFKSQLVEN